MVSVRLTSRELFVYYFKGLEGVHAGGCTNKRVLSKRTGIGYGKLMWVFTRKGKCYYENGDVVIMKLHVTDIEKGGQSFKRRGKGSMEGFLRYTRRDNNY